MALSYWRDGQHEVDFVLQRGPNVVAIEVKSGPRRGSLSGLVRFEQLFKWKWQLKKGPPRPREKGPPGLR